MSNVKKILLISVSLMCSAFIFQNSNASLNSKLSTESGELPIIAPFNGDIESGIVSHMFANRSIASNTFPCSLIGSGLPLVTHYPKIGEKQNPTVFNANGAQSVLNGESNVPMYNSLFKLPTVGNYIGDRYALSNYEPNSVLPSGQTNSQSFESLYKMLCSSKISSVKFKQGAIEIFNNGDIAKQITPKAPYFQILHGVIFRKNLFTIVVPPYWNPTTLNNLPTLMNGFYDINQNLIELEAKNMFSILNSSFVETGKTGFGILWNGRGAIGSRTFDDSAYQDVNDFIKIYLNDLKASNSKFITFGGSRGGSTAFNLASHPLVSAARVAYVYSSVPPYEINMVSKLTSVTVPNLLYASDWSVGIYGSWKKSFVHPATIPYRPDYSGLNGQQSHLMVLTGSYHDVDYISKFNLLTPAKINKLKQNKTQISLEISTHDFIVPSVDQYKLYKDAFANDLDLEVRLNYLIGHESDTPFRNKKILQAFEKLASASSSTSDRFVTKHQVRTFLANPDASYTEFSSSKTRLSVELPKYLNSEIDPLVLATGSVNTNFILIFENSNKSLLVHKFNTDSNGISISKLDPTIFRVGEYKLLYVIEFDSNLNPIFKLNYLSLNKVGFPITLIGFEGDLKPYIANGISNAILEGIRGPSGSQSYFNPGVTHGSNYGFIQTESVALTPAEIQEVKKLLASTPNVPTPAPEKQNANRFYKSATGEHFITLNYNEGINAGFKFEGIAFQSYVSSGNLSNVVGIYRCYHTTFGKHFVSTDINCEGSKQEGSMGFIFTNQVTGSVPLYRYQNSAIHDSLTTKFYNEGVSSGYTFEKILGYVPAN